jgi:hypothetical protein
MNLNGRGNNFRVFVFGRQSIPDKAPLLVIVDKRNYADLFSFG